MRDLNEKQRFLIDTYYQLAEAFDDATQAIMSRSESAAEKASMQAHMMAAVMNDFIQSLPGMTPEYAKQLVDYVFKCREEVLGSGPTMPQMTHSGNNDLN